MARETTRINTAKGHANKANTTTVKTARIGASGVEKKGLQLTESEIAAKISIPARPVLIFTRQLSSMLLSGVHLVEALNTLSHQEEYPQFGEIIRQVCTMLESGVPFSQCISYFPRVFPPIFVTMVQVGERVGALDSSLDKVSAWLERDDSLRRRLISALAYPVFVLALALTLTLGLFYFVMPGFVAIFTDIKADLPWITVLVVWITNSLRNPGILLFLFSVVGLIFSARGFLSHNPEGQRILYRLALRIPLVGALISDAGLARYCSACSTLLSSGVDITAAVTLAANASGSPLLIEDAPVLVRYIAAGGQMSGHMKRNPLYPPTLASMVASGSEVSRVPEMLERAAIFYDIEVGYKVEALGKSIEPILVSGIACVVGTMVLAVFLPIYSILGKLG